MLLMVLCGYQVDLMHIMCMVFCLDLNATYSYGLWKDHAHANGREVMVRRYLGIPKWELSKGLSNVTPLAQSFGAAWD